MWHGEYGLRGHGRQAFCRVATGPSRIVAADASRDDDVLLMLATASRLGPGRLLFAGIRGVGKTRRDVHHSEETLLPRR